MDWRAFPAKTHPSANPQYLWTWPYMEMGFADVIKDLGMRSSWILGWRLNPMTGILISEKRGRSETQKRKKTWKKRGKLKWCCHKPSTSRSPLKLESVRNVHNAWSLPRDRGPVHTLTSDGRRLFLLFGAAKCEWIYWGRARKLLIHTPHVSLLGNMKSWTKRRFADKWSLRLPFQNNPLVLSSFPWSKLVCHHHCSDHIHPASEMWSVQGRVAHRTWNLIEMVDKVNLTWFRSFMTQSHWRRENNEYVTHRSMGPLAFLGQDEAMSPFSRPGLVLKFPCIRKNVY